MTRLVANRPEVISIIIAAILLNSFTLSWLVIGIDIPVTLGLTDGGYRNTLNIDRKQYEAALAKWNNLHLTDYEATIQDSNWGKWKIVVHVDPSYGSKFTPGVQTTYSHRVVHFEALDSEAAKLDAQLYDFVTIGGLFDNLDDYLYCQENSCKERHYFLPSRYKIEFDPTMGYPRSVTSINEYATVETKIENVRILK